ncbi:MAG: hypothetical protein AMJ81_10435 [Phycisphaerae bacterium SM23_33]|nr:MAG: hypothetical protein AMJ81_10435 [Phycisphaerae bacterium SM23_33]
MTCQVMKVWPAAWKALTPWTAGSSAWAPPSQAISRKVLSLIQPGKAFTSKVTLFLPFRAPAGTAKLSYQGAISSRGLPSPVSRTSTSTRASSASAGGGSRKHTSRAPRTFTWAPRAERSKLTCLPSSEMVIVLGWA